MSLTLRMEELSRFRVSADLTSNDGRISLALQPMSKADAVVVTTGVLIHFETVVENGSNKLYVFTSSDGEASTTATTSKATSPPPELAGKQPKTEVWMIF
jgi:hypothetical protein